MSRLTAIFTLAALLSGCAGGYQLKGYTLGASAGKSVYADIDKTFSDKSYTQVGVNANFQFSK